MRKRCKISLMAEAVETLRDNCTVQELVQRVPNGGTIIPMSYPPQGCTSASDDTVWESESVLPFPESFYTFLAISDCSRDSGCMFVLLPTCFRTTKALP